MATERVYLDYNATAPILPSARDAAVHALNLPGNPSSVHAEGRAARQVIEDARAHVGALAGLHADRVVFTSGGTEAAALALRPGATGTDNLLFLAAVEHPCTLQGHGFAAERTRVIPVDQTGRLDLAALSGALTDVGSQPVTLALQAANNETGVLQPVAEAAALVRAHGGHVVCDAVQAAGRIDCTALSASADFIVLTGHKIGGVKGSGALLCASGLPDPAAAMVRGGGQERGLRAGTENVSAIAAFGAAAQWALDNMPVEVERLGGLRDQFERGLAERFADAIVFGANAGRLANTSSFSIPGVSAETLLIAFDIAGLAVSSGSACSSGKVKSSHVLDAMGVEPQVAKGAIRVSLGHQSRQEDINALLGGLETSVAKMKRRPSDLETAA